MLKRYLVAIAVILMAASCKTGGKKGMTPLQYNEFISKLETTLKPEIDKVESNIAVFNSNEQYDSIRVAGLGMQKRIQQDIDQLQQTEAPKGKEADAFKTAAIHYFTFIQSAYKIYEEYGAAASPEKRDEALNKLREKMGHKVEESQNIRTYQEAFARVSGFKVQ